jgi:hypothetical protein
MAVHIKEILEILQANYQKVIALMPPELAKEFQRRIITEDDLNRIAGTIVAAIQFKNVTTCITIENQIIDMFNFRGFSKKLKQNNVNPVICYETLLKGFFDYK